MKNLLLSLLLILPVYAHAGAIFLAGDSNIFDASAAAADNDVFFQNVFNGTSVVNYSSKSLDDMSTTAAETHLGIGASVTAAGLAGKDFMIFGTNRDSVTGAELSAIVDFKNSGGSLFLYGEGNSGFASVNATVNQVLAAVGSTMSLSTIASENFNQPGTGWTTLNPVVGVGPYSVGVNTWRTIYTAGINLGSEIAVISGTSGTGYGVAVAMDGGASVPEPGALALLGLGLFGLGYAKKRKQA